MKSGLTISPLPYLKINLLILPIIISASVMNYYKLLAISYLSAFLHELAHITAAKLCRVKIAYVEIQPFGICAKLKSDIIKSPTAEIFISAAGPLASFIIAYTSYLIQGKPTYLVYCNLATAIINLLPILPLDGGRILRATLSLKMGAVSAYNTSVKISRIPILLIIILSVYSIVTSQFNFSLILIGIFLLGNFFAEQHNISRQAVREMLYYKEKLKPSELTRATVLCAEAVTPARKILSLLSYHRYHIIHITDKDMKVIKTVTEGELLDAICQKGIRITMGEI